MTHEISSTTSCTTVTRATTLEKTRRIFKIITLESQKKWPLIIKFQLEDEACKNHRLKKRGKKSIAFLILARRDPSSSIDCFKTLSNIFHFPPDPLTTSPSTMILETKLPKNDHRPKKKKKRKEVSRSLSSQEEIPHLRSIPSNTFQHPPTSLTTFPLCPHSTTRPNIPQHSTCSTKKKKTIPRIHNSILELEPLKSETMNRVTRASNAEEKPGWLTWLPGGQRGGVAGQEGAFTRVQGSGKRR